MEKRIILKSGKCSWGKCVFCGWGREESRVLSFDELKDEFEKRLGKVEKGKVDVLKIFSSGSFLDEKQFCKEFRIYVANRCKELGIKKLIVESRPEFIREDTLKDFEGVNLTVAIGLEVANDNALLKLNKGFRVEDYVNAVKLLRNFGFGVRTYILVNPPIVGNKYLNESVEFALKYSDSVVLINTFPHFRAPIWEMWIRGEWKPYDEKQFMKAVEKWRDNPKIELDFNNFTFLPKFPKEKRVFLKGVGHKFLTHPYYEVWQDFICRFYKPPKEKKYLLFLPCAYRKPYTKSKTWKALLRKISGFPFFKKIHIVAISSPGVIPFEFIRYYPFTHYDWEEWRETEEIKKEYIEVTERRIENFLRQHASNYKKFFAYFRPDSESLIALKKAFKKLKLKLVVCLNEETYEEVKDSKPALATEEALNDLKETLKKELINGN